MKLKYKELEIIENKVLSISYKLSLIVSLAKTIEEANCNMDNLEKRDLAGLLVILNTYIRIANSKLQKLETYLMHIKHK